MSTQFTDYGILYIDDEVKSLKYFEAIFENLAPIYSANSPEEGFAFFEKNHDRIGLVVSDKRMPNESGLELLKRIRAVDPKPLRFLVTAFSDLDVAVDSLNDGLLYSYLTKPWDPYDLENRLTKAMSHFTMAREREQLIYDKTDAVQQLMMADKAASIGILSTGLNHHLRNALTVLRTFYDLLPYQLEEELDGEPRDIVFWRDYYGEVGSQIDRMTSILTNLSEGTRQSGLKMQEGICLPEVLSQAGTMVLENSPGINFTIGEDAKIPRLIGDAQKLAQMARFLFEESRSTLRKGGDIEIRMTTVDGGASIETTFIDSGELIPEDELERLFDPFFVRRSKPEELGTNLMACYLTVYHHGGTIRAERTADQRNAVIFTLPVVPLDNPDTDYSRRLLGRIADFSRHDMRPAGAALTA
jgi:signal transduction histidine kinase